VESGRNHQPPDLKKKPGSVRSTTGVAGKGGSRTARGKGGPHLGPAPALASRRGGSSSEGERERVGAEGGKHASFQDPGDGPAETHPGRGVGGTQGGERRGPGGTQKNRGQKILTYKKDPKKNIFRPSPRPKKAGGPPPGGGPTLKRSLTCIQWKDTPDEAKI